MAEANVDRRQLERFPVTRSVELTTRTAGERFEGTIVDFSERGLRISTTRHLTENDCVTVHWGECELVGIVVHCKLEHRGFLVGISLATTH